jgi:hypothetical protein
MDTTTFDQYDYIALIVPGTVALYWVAVMFRKTAVLGGLKEISVGGLGVLVIFAFVAGHLAALVGTGVESAWRAAYGYPTDRIIRGEARPFDKSGMALINERIGDVLMRDEKLPRADMSREESYTLGRQIYAVVSAAGRSKRVDLFNQRYGLARDLTGAFLFCALLTPLRFGPGTVFPGKRIRWAVALGFLLAAIGMFYQMTSYGWAYARELFVQFMLIP